MKVIDLTHTIRENMPVYPGTEPPKLSPTSSYESDGFKETLLQMYTHTGTHMDPPAHIFSGRTTLDEFPVDQFIGKALVIDCRELKEGQAITMDPGFPRIHTSLTLTIRPETLGNIEFNCIFTCHLVHSVV